MVLSVLNDDVSFPGKRLFEIFFAIGQHGPITFTQLLTRVDVKRSALHRYCQQLEAMGVVRKRAADKAYQLSYFVDDFMSEANCSLLEVQTLHPHCERFKAEGNFHLTLSAFTSTGVFCDLESTRPARDWAARQSLVFEVEPIIGLSAFKAEDRLPHIIAFMKMATAEEERLIRDGEVNRLIARYSSAEPVLHEDKSKISFLWRPSSGNTCVVTVEADKSNDLLVMGRYAKELQDTLLHSG